MFTYSIIPCIACVTYVYLGILTLLIGKNTAVQKSFACLCGMLALWAFGSIGQYIFQEQQLALLFDRIYYFGSELFILAGLIFVMYLTQNWQSKPLRILLLCIVMRITIYQTANIGWNLIAKDYPNNFWFMSHQVIAAIESYCIPIILFLWMKRTKLHRERMQAIIIIISTLVGTIVGVLVDFFAGSSGIQPISSAIPMLWMIAIWIAITHYGLLRHSPAQVNRELIYLMNEALFIIDSDWNITDLNGAALFLLERDVAPKEPLPLHEVFQDAEAIMHRIEAAETTQQKYYTKSEIIQTSQGHLLAVTTSFSIVSDKWNDRIGILCMCHLQQDLHAFSHRYALSPRQTDILRHIISGRSQGQTAEALFLSLSTVKSHTTSLYNRLGISSRSELFALLRSEALKFTGA